ncbi:MAG: hypothetical protein A2885_14680 [Sphingopyxis sp. RIFCSPHIGHO2_01_FULL_65_24]|nr:MAG: hypothetical protein A2885_14680 [Sphingopyxis sp. RIFCSPHIGHO2_01_FULL_65_24]
MSEQIRYKPSLTLRGLQIKLRNDEALYLKLTAIEVDGPDTVGTFEDGEVAPRSLQIFLDAAGTFPAPSGSTLVVRGEAMILDAKQKVAVFRIS